MNSNSNYNITKVTVDPVSQEITNLEVNGKEINTGGGEVQEKVISTLNVSSLFPASGGPDSIIIEPDEGYDAMSSVEIQNVIGYPTYDTVLIAKCARDNSDENYAWIAFKANIEGEYTHLAELIITGSGARVWKLSDNADGGAFGVQPVFSNLTIGSEYVSIEIDRKIYDSADLDAFLVAYLPHQD